MKILCVCTGNSCRSPMAAGFLRSLDGRITVHSAGVKPESAVSAFAIKAMRGIFVDISDHIPQQVQSLDLESYQLIISFSRQAQNYLSASVSANQKLIFIGLDDPAMAIGSETKILNAYREVRDDIKNECFKVYIAEIRKKQHAKS